jgi:chemotaxis protein CheX
VTFDDDDLRAITGEVFGLMLGLDCAPAPAPGSAARPDEADLVTGCVQVAGAWSGAVTLDLAADLARLAAAAMFSADPRDLSPGDVDDAVGELANMTGGNVKNLVRGASQLSLPAVAQGNGVRMTIPGAVVRNQLDFVCAGRALRVTVLERREETSA